MFGRPPKSPEKLSPTPPVPAATRIEQNKKSATELRNVAGAPQSPHRETPRPDSRNTPQTAPVVGPPTPTSSPTGRREGAPIVPSTPSSTPPPQTNQPQNRTNGRNGPANLKGIKKENAGTIFSRMENENRDIPDPAPVRPERPTSTTTRKTQKTTTTQPEAPRSTPSSQRIGGSGIRDEGGIPWGQSAEDRQRIYEESHQREGTTVRSTNNKGERVAGPEAKQKKRSSPTTETDFITIEEKGGRKKLLWKSPTETTWSTSDGGVSSGGFPENLVTRGTQPPVGYENLYKPVKPEPPVKPAEPVKPEPVKPATEAINFEVTTQEGKEGEEQKNADEAHVKSRRNEARKNLEKENGWNNLNTQEQAEKIDAHLAAEDETNKQILKTQMEYARDSEKKKQDVVDPNDAKLKAIQKQKPLEKEKLPEAVTPEKPGEKPQSTKENGKATPPTIEPNKVKTPGDKALDGYMNGDDGALTREMRRDRDFMANTVEKAQDRLIDAFSERTGTDVRKTINESGTSKQLNRIPNVDQSHHAEINESTKQTLKKVMSGYYQYNPEVRMWTDRSGSIVQLPAEHKEAVGKFLRATAPEHPYGKLTAEHDPYSVTRGNNPFKGEPLDPRKHGNIVDFHAQIGAHRPFEEELKHIRETLKKLKPTIPEQSGFY